MTQVQPYPALKGSSPFLVAPLRILRQLRSPFLLSGGRPECCVGTKARGTMALPSFCRYCRICRLLCFFTFDFSMWAFLSSFCVASNSAKFFLHSPQFVHPSFIPGKSLALPNAACRLEEKCACHVFFYLNDGTKTGYSLMDVSLPRIA